MFFFIFYILYERCICTFYIEILVCLMICLDHCIHNLTISHTNSQTSIHTNTSSIYPPETWKLDGIADQPVMMTNYREINNCLRRRSFLHQNNCINNLLRRSNSRSAYVLLIWCLLQSITTSPVLLLSYLQKKSSINFCHRVFVIYQKRPILRQPVGRHLLTSICIFYILLSFFFYGYVGSLY